VKCVTQRQDAAISFLVQRTLAEIRLTKSRRIPSVALDIVPRATA
jgi:hypothetical protein